MPRISVLVPTYNRAHYLAEAVESVRAQTYRDWELIVVDDGSTDDTQDVIRQFTGPIYYIYQPNQGVSVARNRAFEASVGAYIVFLDSDDLLLPNAVETWVNAIESNRSIDIVYSDGYIVDEVGTRVSELSAYRRTPIEDTIESFVLDNAVGLHSTMIRREVLFPQEGPFDSKMLGYEDWDLFIRLKAAGCRFQYIPAFTCCYRFHGGNKSAPKSTYAEKRRQSLVHSRMKVLNAPWFDSLSLSARYKFFLDFLTSTLKEDWLFQEQVLAHPAFKKIPPKRRARLLYYLASENALANTSRNQDLRHLITAIRLRPLDPRPYSLLVLSLLGSRIRRWVIRKYRQMRSKQLETDPITKILRAKKVA